MVIGYLLSDNIIRCQRKKENPTTPYQTPSLHSGVVRPIQILHLLGAGGSFTMVSLGAIADKRGGIKLPAAT
jgi:hypothetical protein